METDYMKALFNMRLRGDTDTSLGIAKMVVWLCKYVVNDII